MRMLVVGAGAVGGYLGARWIDADRDVTMLVREKRRAHLATSGLVVIQEGRELSVQPKTISAEELVTPFEIVFIAVTGDALPYVLDQIGPAVGPFTSIVTALNGVRHFDALRQTFGDEAVLGSVVKCVTRLAPDGKIVELSPSAEITLGRWSGSEDDGLRAIQKFMEIDKLDVRLSSTIEEEIHEKWLMMIVLGAANALLGGDVGEINAVPTGVWAIQELLNEGQRALDEIGMPPRPSAVEALSRMLADSSSHQTSSLYRNMLARRGIEVEPIVGDLISRLVDHRAYPLLSAAYARLSIYAASVHR